MRRDVRRLAGGLLPGGDAVTDRPIIFSAPMIRALLAGTKTQTRRVLKPQPVLDHGALGIEDRQGRWIFCANTERGFAEGLPQSAFRMPYAPGDRLWVREAFTMGFDYDDREIPIGDVPKPFYAATYDGAHWYDSDRDEWRDEPRWTPSIHMPRWASRLTLTVTDVRVQRLNEISERDAIAEGVDPIGVETGRFDVNGNAIEQGSCAAAFAALWDELHGPGAWSANPWVVALTFTVALRNIDAMEKVA